MTSLNLQHIQECLLRIILGHAITRVVFSHSVVINVDVFGELQYATCIVWRLQHKYYAKQFVKLTNILGGKETF